MSKVESLLQNLEVSESSKHVISKVLSKLDPEALSAWSEKLQVKDGKVIGTFYSDIGAKLPFNDFVALYEALGYDFGKMGYWRDWWCYSGLGCMRQPGYTCNLNFCPEPYLRGDKIMEKVAGFEIELTNGIIILAIPRGDNSSFTVSNLTFTITQEGKAFAQVAIAVDLQADSTDIGVKSIRKAMLEKPDSSISGDASKDHVGILRTCSVCNGTPYCVTNGCVNIGCGWLCD